MGGPGSGARVDKGRRRRVLRLRSQGLTLDAVAARLRVTRQTVCNDLKAAGAYGTAARCAWCRREVGPRLREPGDAPAYCPDCLDRHPDVSFAVRLKSWRLTLGLTVAGLARELGLATRSVRQYEHGRCLPGWYGLCRLARVLGAGILPPGPSMPLVRAGGDGHPPPGAVSPRCRDCGVELAPGHRRLGNNGPAYCFPCLARHPEATFGQRLRAHRLAAGLTLAGLGACCGLSSAHVSEYERDVVVPKWKALVDVLGRGLFPPVPGEGRGADRRPDVGG